MNKVPPVSEILTSLEPESLKRRGAVSPVGCSPSSKAPALSPGLFRSPIKCLTRAQYGRNMAALETRVLPAQVWPGIRWDLVSLLPRLTPSVCPRL